VYNIGFADDVNILAIGKTTKETCEKLERVHHICIDWAERHGAKFAPEKYKVIHLTRRNLQAQEKQRLPNIGILNPPVDTL
jgi:hypothetical protein